ncbi:GntR family transcriptional regulator [Herbidospora mongoliensis]|uniref:GntR family transcriptional regulator n=1 Tax=Herbidospora mongoliensis TaxID=688067 RepID=UPI000B0AF11A|nr:GntR family transcriptional regulator [Herbidospora mongoliensis]
MKLYVQVADIVRDEIQEGEMPPGSRAPSEKELKDRFGVARQTARRALLILRDEGLLEAVPGRGTFVGPVAELEELPARKTWTYERIAADVAAEIRSGRRQPNKAIPSELQFSQIYDCSIGTVRRAVAVLRDQGWVYTLPQQGTYVSEPQNWPSE